ncbi:hypothetical protein O181_067957 [Austropuccinia psidii MF-1]|uniref:C2 domain-containing protein n=1 Tax=Austropuccinia psidii MF-1 TaxID=1389203 RepID=A0A9Q3F1P9_9BASI|nr:hypothetical protein [Austropuccinia psidii MF-1]
MNNFPHLQLIDLSFLEKPEFDFVSKPIRFDLNMIPGLSSFIESQVHATLGPMMYDPNVFTLNLEQMLAGALVDSAIGVLQVTLVSAHGLKAVKIGGGTPDPYVTFSIGAQTNLDRSKLKRATTNPCWSSVHFLLNNSLNEILSLEILDYNEVRKDTSLGLANIDLISLITKPEQESLMVPILHNGKCRGEVKLRMNYHPCLVPKKLEHGEEEPVPETTAGVKPIWNVAYTIDCKDISSVTGTELYLPHHYIVFINGNILGLTWSPGRWVQLFRQFRRARKVYEFVSIYMKFVQQTVNIATDSGGICCPMIIVSNGNSMVTTRHIENDLNDDTTIVPPIDVMVRTKPKIKHHEDNNNQTNHKRKLTQSQRQHIDDSKQIMSQLGHSNTEYKSFSTISIDKKAANASWLKLLSINTLPHPYATLKY